MGSDVWFRGVTAPASPSASSLYFRPAAWESRHRLKRSSQCRSVRSMRRYLISHRCKKCIFQIELDIYTYIKRSLRVASLMKFRGCLSCYPIYKALWTAGMSPVFFLTGSHQPELHNAISQSLAGRTALLTLLPFSVRETSFYPIEYSVFEYIVHWWYAFQQADLH